MKHTISAKGFERLRSEDSGLASQQVRQQSELDKIESPATPSRIPAAKGCLSKPGAPQANAIFSAGISSKIIIHPVGQGARTFDKRAVEIISTFLPHVPWPGYDDLGHPDNGECVLDGCDRKRVYSLPPKGTGLCSVHETRRRDAIKEGRWCGWDRGPALHRRPPRGTCEAEYEGKLCERKNRAEGLCIMHYMRMKTARDRGLGDDWDRSPEVKRGHGYHHGRPAQNQQPCAVVYEGERCGNEARKDGLCVSHYERMMRAKNRGQGDNWNRSPIVPRGFEEYRRA